MTTRAGCDRPRNDSPSAADDRSTDPGERQLDALNEASARGGVPIAPLPLVLDDGEYQQIAAGAAQRVAMLQLLFHDLFCSRQRVLDHVLDSSLVDRIIDLHGWRIGDLRAFWDGADLDAVRFIYGPDLIRDVDGRWLLLEDNIGCLGGVGNGGWVLEQFLQTSGLRGAPGLPVTDDLRSGVEAFLTRSAVSDRRPDVVCLAGQAPLTAPDTDGGEERRKCRSMASAGLTTTTIEQAAASSVGCRTRPPPSSTSAAPSPRRCRSSSGRGSWTPASR